MDDNGFPLDESYLREQGLNLVDLNREYVNQQEQLKSLTEVLNDKQLRQEFLAALDGNTNGNNQPATQRQTFPGGEPGQQQEQQDLEAAYSQIKELTRLGYPIDNLPAIYQGWDSIDNENWKKLASTLIQGDY